MFLFLFQTYTCQLFSGAAIDIFIELLSKQTKPNKNILTKTISKTTNFVKDQVGTMTNFINNSIKKKSKRSIDGNKIIEKTKIQILPLKAYVFYNNSIIQFHKVEDENTIKHVETNQKSYLNWTGITNDQTCFKLCLNSWNKLTSLQNEICRFLVVKVVVNITTTV